MALGDPFQTTFEGAQQGLGTFGAALGQIGKQVGNRREEDRLKLKQDQELEKKKQNNLSILKQFGVLKQDDLEPDVTDYEKALSDNAAQIGLENLKITGSTDPEKRKKEIDAILKPLGLSPQPKKTEPTIDVKKAAELGVKLDPNTWDVSIDPKPSVSSALTTVPEGFEVQGYDQKGQPMIRKTKDAMDSPTLERQRIQMLEKVSGSYRQNEAKKKSIDEARIALKDLPSGLGGKLQIMTMKATGSKDPVLGKWQKVKAVLTDATLLNTMKTKGAISDKEMELFKNAAADNDLSVVPAVEESLNRYERIIDAENQANIDSYKAAYGQDPLELIGGNNQPQSSQNQSQQSQFTPEQIQAEIKRRQQMRK